MRAQHGLAVRALCSAVVAMPASVQRARADYCWLSFVVHCQHALESSAVGVQEELNPPGSSDSPRAHSLGRLIECAYLNLPRIRLVWQRLWAATSAHLVSAACHADSGVAALAVEHMRGLISRLLARAELSHFTHQASALPCKPTGRARSELQHQRLHHACWGLPCCVQCFLSLVC